MEIKKAGDAMIPLDEYPHIPYWFTIRQAMAEMEKTEVGIEDRKSLPRQVLVFNESYELLGMVRRRDILRGLEPEFLADIVLPKRKKLLDFRGKSSPEVSFDKLLKGIKERAERPVSDIMSPIKVSVDFEDNIIKVIYEMVDNNLSMIPVLKEKEVVGVVRTVEIVHEVDQLLQT